jgi:hypothetical protein
MNGASRKTARAFLVGDMLIYHIVGIIDLGIGFCGGSIEW